MLKRNRRLVHKRHACRLRGGAGHRKLNFSERGRRWGPPIEAVATQARPEKKTKKQQQRRRVFKCGDGQRKAAVGYPGHYPVAKRLQATRTNLGNAEALVAVCFGNTNVIILACLDALTTVCAAGNTNIVILASMDAKG